MLSWNLAFIAFIIFIALAFDFTNGLHDAANSVATVVSTRVLSHEQAVIWAAFFNFVAFLLFGTTVAHTIGTGLIEIVRAPPGKTCPRQSRVRLRVVFEVHVLHRGIGLGRPPFSDMIDTFWAE